MINLIINHIFVTKQNYNASQNETRRIRCIIPDVVSSTAVRSDVTRSTGTLRITGTLWCRADRNTFGYRFLGALAGTFDVRKFFHEAYTFDFRQLFHVWQAVVHFIVFVKTTWRFFKYTIVYVVLYFHWYLLFFTSCCYS